MIISVPNAIICTCSVGFGVAWLHCNIDAFHWCPGWAGYPVDMASHTSTMDVLYIWQLDRQLNLEILESTNLVWDKSCIRVEDAGFRQRGPSIVRSQLRDNTKFSRFTSPTTILEHFHAVNPVLSAKSPSTDVRTDARVFLRVWT